MSVTVSIVNYRTADRLPACVAAVCTRVPTLAHIIVVDHDTAPLPHLPSTVPLTIIRQDNAGFGAGHNRAARETTDDFLLFLNPDALLTTSLDTLLTHITDPRVAVVAPLLTDANDRADPFCAGQDHTLLRLLSAHLHLPALPSAAGTVDRVSGAAMLVRRDAFLAVGGFDENYFAYFEDADLCRRLRDNGHLVVFDPSVTVRHDGSASFSDRRRQKAIYDASQDRYLRTYRPHLEAVVAGMIRRVWRRVM